MQPTDRKGAGRRSGGVLRERSPVSSRASPSPSRRAVVLATLLAGSGSLLLLWLPVYGAATESSSTGPDGIQVLTGTASSATLLEVNGPRIGMVLLVPLLLTGVPLVVPGRRGSVMATVLSALALSALVVLTGFSIGLFYLPSALALVVGAWLAVRELAGA
jgi:hypothetical protein